MVCEDLPNLEHNKTIFEEAKKFSVIVGLSNGFLFSQLGLFKYPNGLNKQLTQHYLENTTRFT